MTHAMSQRGCKKKTSVRNHVITLKQCMRVRLIRVRCDLRRVVRIRAVVKRKIPILE